MLRHRGERFPFPERIGEEQPVPPRHPLVAAGAVHVDIDLPSGGQLTRRVRVGGRQPRGGGEVGELRCNVAVRLAAAGDRVGERPSEEGGGWVGGEPEAGARKRDDDAVPGDDVVRVRDVGVVGEQLGVVGDAEEGGDEGEVGLRGEVVGGEGQRAARTATVPGS